MTEDEFTKLKETIKKRGGREITEWRGNISTLYSSYSHTYVKFVSKRSKYTGSILLVRSIKADKIKAICSITGAAKISSTSNFKNFELTNATAEKYCDTTIGVETIKDFFDDDINIGDYVFGEYDRMSIFGIVRSTKKADPNIKRGYTSKILANDAAMIEVIKIKSRDGYPQVLGDKKLLEMKYFIKVEDPTLYLLKL